MKGLRDERPWWQASSRSLALVGGGAAVAATQLGTPKQESQAIVDDAARAARRHAQRSSPTR